ncbi:MAG: SDR family oxidoreductase [Burkholderiales bacterium]
MQFSPAAAVLQHFLAEARDSGRRGPNRLKHERHATMLGVGFSVDTHPAQADAKFVCHAKAESRLASRGRDNCNAGTLFFLPNSVSFSDHARVGNSIDEGAAMGRAGDVGEIASIAVFLASEASSYVAGQVIYADGGRLPLNYTV